MVQTEAGLYEKILGGGQYYCFTPIKYIVLGYQSQAIIIMLVLVLTNIIAIYWGHSASHDVII